MPNPQQPELRRSDKGAATDQDQREQQLAGGDAPSGGGKAHGTDKGNKGGGEGGGVPPGNKPGWMPR